MTQTGLSTVVKKMNYEIMSGKKPTEYLAPMTPKDHPELDLLLLLDENYQTIPVLYRRPTVASNAWTV
jgi:hypothetical protein